MRNLHEQWAAIPELPKALIKYTINHMGVLMLYVEAQSFVRGLSIGIVSLLATQAMKVPSYMAVEETGIPPSCAALVFCQTGSKRKDIRPRIHMKTLIRGSPYFRNFLFAWRGVFESREALRRDQSCKAGEKA